jgi:hypothetical protein
LLTSKTILYLNAYTFTTHTSLLSCQKDITHNPAATGEEEVLSLLSVSVRIPTRAMEEQFYPSENNTNAGQKTSKETRQPFPVKVYEMLEDADAKDFAHIVSWNSQGNGFMVLKKDMFIHQIVPKYFNQTKYKSFQRQLSLYGFQRVTVGPNKGLRHHDKLRRGQYDLVCQMKPVGYKPRGTTKMIAQHQQLQQDNLEPPTVASSSAVPIVVYQQETSSASSPMTVVGAYSEVIPTVISSSSIDKLCTLTADQVNTLQRRQRHLVSSGGISEGEEESSSEEQFDEELQDLLEKGLFEGMGFYLMMQTQHVPEEVLPFSTLPLEQVANVPLPPQGVMDAELKKAWQTGYSIALSMNATTLPTDALKTPQEQTAPTPPSFLDDCVDALDFHAANIAATTGANL